MARPRVFLDITIGTEPAGRLTIELFADKTPKTCENFRQLCTGEHDGLSYAKAPFHRVIDEFMIQGGDIENGDGTGRTSIYGNEFEDENLNWREMDAAGLVCSANGGKDTNGSQFFITLEPCPHLNGKHTIFGHLVGGEETLKKIAAVDVDKKDRPKEPVLIARCGELEKRKKKAPQQTQQEQVSQNASRDRGRRRRSTDRDVEMSNSPEPRYTNNHSNKSRRQSDNVVDEGIRGRPRNRSATRSNSRPLSTQSEEDETGNSTDQSSNRMHKRKRSASPSRHGEGERRRRSLPNQYRDDRFQRPREDDDRYRPSPRRGDYQHPDRRRRDDDRYSDRRQDDRYRPSRERKPYEDHVRLGGGDSYDEYDQPPVKFKGRGVMKYREPDRAW